MLADSGAASEAQVRDVEDGHDKMRMGERVEVRCEEREKSRCARCWESKGWKVAIVAYLLLVLILNLLCAASWSSPFYNFNAGLSAAAVGGVVVLLYLLALVWVYRATISQTYEKVKSEPGTTSKAKAIAPSARTCKLCTLLGLAFALTCTLVFFGAKFAAYPGIAATLPSEERPADAVLTGEEFVFKSRKDGALLEGYRALFSNEDHRGAKALANNTNITHVVPVVMIGGNGGSMWYNVFSGNDFVMDEFLQRNQSIAFDIFAFSYRGYAPNEFPALQVNENTMIQDSLSLFEYVEQKYPDSRPLLFSHSMGTGSASALASILDTSQVACIGLAMPFSSLRQTMLEVSLYAVSPFFFLLDTWNSYQRLAEMQPEIPLAILSAGQDHLIAPHHQQELYDRATSKSKRIFYLAQADHGAILDTIRHNQEEYAKWFQTSCMDRTTLK